MSLWDFFGNSNSVILEWDHIDDLGFAGLQEQVEEVSKYYRFSSLEELCQRLKDKKRQGLAVLTFRNPRKSVLLRAVPYLIGKKIPFTLFLRSDCVGLNELPKPEMELFRQSLRNEPGAPELKTVDPTRFFATWGKLNELPRNLVEWGITLTKSESDLKVVEDEILFMRHRLGIAPRVAKLENSELAWTERSLAHLGLIACLNATQGAVKRNSVWFNLPIWHFSA
jgi:hypothetical protein